jgi:hypothetical protein
MVMADGQQGPEGMVDAEEGEWKFVRLMSSLGVRITSEDLRKQMGHYIIARAVPRRVCMYIGTHPRTFTMKALVQDVGECVV